MDDWESASQANPQDGPIGLGGCSHRVERLFGRTVAESQNGILLDQLGMPVEKEYSDEGLILESGDIQPPTLGLVCCIVHPSGNSHHILPEAKALWCDFGGHWICQSCGEQLSDGRGVCYLHADRAIQKYNYTFRQALVRILAEPFGRLFGEKISHPKTPPPPGKLRDHRRQPYDRPQLTREPKVINPLSAPLDPQAPEEGEVLSDETQQRQQQLY